MKIGEERAFVEWMLCARHRTRELAWSHVRLINSIPQMMEWDSKMLCVFLKDPALPDFKASK